MLRNYIYQIIRIVHLWKDINVFYIPYKYMKMMWPGQLGFFFFFFFFFFFSKRRRFEIKRVIVIFVDFFFFFFFLLYGCIYG
jgi:hypothetical protein